MRKSLNEQETAELALSGQSGSGQPVLVAFTGRGMETFPLPASGQVTVGRSREADICIDVDALSRKHATLELGPPLRVRDLGSSNGTRVRGVAIPPNGWVEVAAGEVIELGAVLLLVQARPSARPTPVAGKDPERALVGCDAMAEVYRLVDKIAPGEISVLLLGETGVGKEVVAEAVHRRSPRARGAFVRLNCAAFSESLLESELFGHERGAFTGAIAAKPGLLESAAHGTVFLDEVGDLPPAVQAKLLRVLEEGAVRRIGSVTPRPLDVRFVAATNRDLQVDIASGKFRRDLFFRIAAATIEIPPLRERRAEIAPLARLFVERVATQLGRPAPSLTAAALARLEGDPWPGNVRELRNVIERAVLVSSGDRIDAADFPAPGGSPAATAPSASSDPDERRRIEDALQKCAGNQSKAAKLLGIARRTLINRLDHYGIARPQKKPGA